MGERYGPTFHHKGHKDGNENLGVTPRHQPAGIQTVPGQSSYRKNTDGTKLARA